MAQVFCAPTGEIATTGGHAAVITWWPGVAKPGTWQDVSGCPPTGSNGRLRKTVLEQYESGGGAVLQVEWDYSGTDNVSFRPVFLVVAP
ncbi:hypothetical protein [Streptomyces sp. NPDC001678]|uniref:hypothetical protein n=1 Tax=Streptomyces sp. NPDC001678 TaxID=3364599 RepID=UPI0036C025A5